jgi:serine/threonine protein kinase
MDLPVGPKYRAKLRIGGGSFGDIYLGESLSSGESVAIKVEPSRIRPSQVLNESRIYRALGSAVGIPAAKWYGVVADNSILVLELLGKSLEALFLECEKRFSLKTVLMIADQLLTRIEFIHHKGILHRDIKPENFVLGQGLNSDVIYAIDFGLSRRWQDAKTGEHIPYEEGKQLLGTARYTSVNTHMGIEQSRRDDLEGIAYVLIYLVMGSLPWVGLKGQTREQKRLAIAQLKASTPPERLCAGLPSAFSNFLIAVRRLDFTEEPRYSIYRELFRELFLNEGYVYDGGYDWVRKVAPKSLVCPLLKVTEMVTHGQRRLPPKHSEDAGSKLPPMSEMRMKVGGAQTKVARPRHLMTVVKVRRRSMRS